MVMRSEEKMLDRKLTKYQVLRSVVDDSDGFQQVLLDKGH